MRRTLLSTILLFTLQVLAAQIPIGGTPPALELDKASLFSSLEKERQTLARLDLQTILAEDKNGSGVRFAVPISVDFSLQKSGKWTDLPNGDRVWRLYIQSVDAKALIAFYEDFYLPSAAQLFMYTPDGSQILGPYTAKDNPANGRFMTGLLYGSEAIIEYLEPVAVRDQGRMSIKRIDHAYKSVARSEQGGGRSPVFGFGSSLPCQIEADCPLGDPVEDLKRSVCRIFVVVEEGTGYCTGNLMNNTAEDGTPYIYTGFHCMDGFTPIYDLWRFDFQYRAVGCDPAVTEPQSLSVLGSTYRAGRRENDFLLLELNKAVPNNFSPHFMGWNRQDGPPDTSYMLHHPRGDVQKVSRSTEKGTIFNGPIFWSNDVTTPRSHHFDVDFTEGNYELGSSGAAQINEKGQLVGHLNGGNPDTSACDFSQAWFGRFSLAWDGGGAADSRLRDWLDPLGTDTAEMGGLAPVATQTVNGMIATYWNETPVAGVEVTLSLDGNDLTVTSGNDGSFSFENVGAANIYTLSFSKNTSASNGVSGLDILDIQKHILSLENLLGPYRLLAADINLSGSISGLDIIGMRRVILALETELAPNVESWAFLPKGYSFPDPAKPWTPTPPQSFTANDVAELQDLEILAIKLGDVNDSAKGGG